MKLPSSRTRTPAQRTIGRRHDSPIMAGECMQSSRRGRSPHGGTPGGSVDRGCIAYDHRRGGRITVTAPFTFKGINHLALVCRDMARTVDVLPRRARHAADQDHRAAGRHGPALLLRLRRRRPPRLLLVPRRPRAGAPASPRRPARPDHGDLDDGHRVDEPRGLRRAARARSRSYVERLRDRRHRVHRGRQPRRQRVGHRRRDAPTACSSGRSTSRTPTGSCSSSRPGPARSRAADVVHEPATRPRRSPTTAD